MIRPVFSKPNLIPFSSLSQSKSGNPKGKIISVASTKQSGLPKAPTRAPSEFEKFSQRATLIKQIGERSEAQRLAVGPVLLYAPPDRNIQELSLRNAVSLLTEKTNELRKALENGTIPEADILVYVQDIGPKKLKNEIFPDLQENKGWEALETLFFSGESRQDHISTALGLLDLQIDDAVSAGKTFNLNIIDEEGKHEKIEIKRDPENSNLYSLKYDSSPQKVHQLNVGNSEGQDTPELLRVLTYLVEREIVSSQKRDPKYWSQSSNDARKSLISGDLGNIIEQIRGRGGENLLSILSLGSLEPEIDKVSGSLQGRVRKLLFGDLTSAEIKPENLLTALELLQNENAILPKQIFQTDLPAPTRPHTKGYGEKHRLTVAKYLGETQTRANEGETGTAYEPISSNPSITAPPQYLHLITQQPVPAIQSPANVSTVEPGELSKVTTPHTSTDSAVVSPQPALLEDNVSNTPNQDGVIKRLSLEEIIGVKQGIRQEIDALKKQIEAAEVSQRRLEELMAEHSTEDLEKLPLPRTGVFTKEAVGSLYNRQASFLQETNDALKVKQDQLETLTTIEQQQRQQTASEVIDGIIALGKNPAQKESILSALLKRLILPPFYLSLEDKQFIQQETVLHILNSMIPWGHLRRQHLQINERSILSKNFQGINMEDNKSLNTLALINSVLNKISNPQELLMDLKLTQKDDLEILASRYTRFREIIIQQTQPQKGFAKVPAPALNFSSERLKTLASDYYSNSDEISNLLKSSNGRLKLLMDVHSQWVDLCRSYDIPDSHKESFPTIDKQKYQEINYWLAKLHEDKPTSIQEVLSNLPDNVKSILGDDKKFLKFVKNREDGTKVLAQEAASREERAKETENKKTDKQRDNEGTGGTTVKPNPVQPKTPQGGGESLSVTESQRSSDPEAPATRQDTQFQQAPTPNTPQGGEVEVPVSPEAKVLDENVIPVSLGEIMGLKQDLTRQIEASNQLSQKSLAEIQEIKGLLKSPDLDLERIIPEGSFLSGGTVLDVINYLLAEQNSILQEEEKTLTVIQTALGETTQLEQKKRQQTASKAQADNPQNNPKIKKPDKQGNNEGTGGSTVKSNTPVKPNTPQGGEVELPDPKAPANEQAIQFQQSAAPLTSGSTGSELTSPKSEKLMEGNPQGGEKSLSASEALKSPETGGEGAKNTRDSAVAVTDNNSGGSDPATIAKPTSISFSKLADSCTQLPTTKGNPTDSERTLPENGTTAEPNLVGREIPQSGRESLSVREAPESSEAGGEVPENTSEQVPTAKPTSITDFSKWADSCTQLPTTAENSPDSELTSPDSGENNNPLKDAEIPWTNIEVVQTKIKPQTYDSASIRESALVADSV